MRILRRPAAAIRLPVAVFALLLAAFAAPGAAHAQPGGHDHASHAHPQPAKAKSHHPNARPGINGANVLRTEDVPERARDAYTIAARIPQVLDALFCHCDCHERDGRRSLLECFHDDMAATCGICQRQARMAGEMHDGGKSLAHIRAAIDQHYGGG